MRGTEGVRDKDRRIAEAGLRGWERHDNKTSERLDSFVRLIKDPCYTFVAHCQCSHMAILAQADIFKSYLVGKVMTNLSRSFSVHLRFSLRSLWLWLHPEAF